MDRTLPRRRFLAGSMLVAAAAAWPHGLGAAGAPQGARRRSGATQADQLLAIARSQLARLGAAIPLHDRVGIADFGLHASVPRFHLIDMASGRIQSMLVSHGEGSDMDNDGWLNAYSDVEGSLATSRGAYRSGEQYSGKYGTSMRLDGLDPTNASARARAIVMHGADYATPAHVKRWGRVGRSWGCLALAPTDLPRALRALVDGRLIYVESLGIKADGTRTGRKAGNLVPLDAPGRRDRARLLPGVQ